jgi:hypothetical protein
MSSGTDVTNLPLVKTVIPYSLFDHSSFCRPDVGCDSVDAGGNCEPQNPRNLVRVDTAVNINFGVDRINKTWEVGRHRSKEGDSSTPIL